MLTDAEIDLLLRLDHHARSLLVLDAREEPALFHALFPRPWAPGGFVRRPLYGGVLPPLHVIRSDKGPRPLLVLLDDSPLPRDLEPLLEDSPAPWVVRGRGAELSRDHRPLEDLDPVPSRAGSTSILLQGRNQTHLTGVDLPQTFRVRPAPRPGRSLVGVGASNAFDEVLAPQSWFRVPGEGVVEVRLEIHPGWEGDRWQASVAGRPAEVVRVATEPRPVEKLGLLVDRTCPDRDHWNNARLMLVDPRHSRDADDLPLWPLYNRGVLDGLAQGFRSLPEPAPAEVHLAWFADLPGHGVAGIESVDFPEEPSGDPGSASSGRIGDLLESCTYSPGLDLWDPLEEGLERLARPFLKRPRPGMGILIVGNSPPNLPVDGASPFHSLLEAGGIATTARRKNSKFTRLVKDLGDEGIPLVYLFLTHGGPGPDEMSHFQSLSERVRVALSSYVEVVTAAADEGGVARGLAEALRVLSRPQVSGATVLASGG